MSTLKPIRGEKELWYDPKSGFIHFRAWIDGKRKTRSTKIQLSKEQFQILENGTPKEIDSVLRIPRRVGQAILKDFLKAQKKYVSKGLVEDEWAEWIALKAPTWAERTIFDIQEKGRIHLLPFFGSMRPEDAADEMEWDKYVSFKRTEGVAKKLKGHRTYWSMFLHHLGRKGIIPSVPKLNNPDGETLAGKVFSSIEIEKLLLGADPELRLQILMALKMGMRGGEIVNLRWDRVDLEKKMIRLRDIDTKTRKARSVPIHNVVLNELEALCLMAYSEFVFPAAFNKERAQTRNRSAWQRLKKRVGVKGRFHDLRHTCATEMAHSNISPTIACRILGMSLEVYDKVYCKPSEDKLRESLNSMNWGDE